jgi:hypothetical protein
MAHRTSQQPQLRKDDTMINLAEELLILKSLIKMYETALAQNDKVLVMEIAVDIAESAEKLEQRSVDNANAN